MTKRPVLFTDVDGVINILVRPQFVEKYQVWPTVMEGTANGYIIQWSPEMIEALNQLVADFDLDHLWLTTWRADAAPKIGAMVGFGSESDFLPWFRGFSDYSSLRGKVLALIEWAQENPGTPFVFIDDEFFSDDFGGSRAESIRRAGGLPVGSDPRSALSPENIAEIRTYLTEKTVNTD